MAGRRAIYLICVIGCVVFYTSYQLWFSGFVLAAILLLPLFSLLVSLPGILTARLEIRTPGSVPLGAPQELTVFYGSVLPTPPWRCKLRVERPLTHQHWKLDASELLPTAHCGALICTIRKARVCDYLGLFAFPMRHGGPQRILVLPRPVPIRIPSLDGGITKAWRPKRGGGFAENHELRLYRPGDSIQQIHWKLSAKTGSLILREPMEPVRGRVLLRLDLKGSETELDRKLGQLLWLGQQMLHRDLHFRVQALTGRGVESWPVTDEASLTAAIDRLLCREPATDGSLRDRPVTADWQYFIGGVSDEA